MDEEIEDLDSTNETELEDADTDLETDSTDEDLSDVDDVEALKEKNKQLFARAKKAEAELKKTKVVKEQPKQEEHGSLDENKLNELLDKRELEHLELSDELKSEVQNYAKLKGVSVKKALSSDYISFLKENDEKKRRVEEASLGGKSKAPSKKDFSSAKPTDFDLSTKEGRAEYAKYEDYLRKELG